MHRFNWNDALGGYETVRSKRTKTTYWLLGGCQLDGQTSALGRACKYDCLGLVFAHDERALGFQPRPAKCQPQTNQLGARTMRDHPSAWTKARAQATGASLR